MFIGIKCLYLIYYKFKNNCSWLLKNIKFNINLKLLQLFNQRLKKISYHPKKP